jgi:hypothetical protein
MPVDDELLIDVTFDPARGYVATHANLLQPVIALSLTVLRASNTPVRRCIQQ